MFAAKIKHHPRQRPLEASGDVSTRPRKAPTMVGVDMAMDADDYPTDLIKRLLDLLIASAAIALTLPLMLLVSLLIKCDSPGPILYRQERVGLRGRTFALYKFRSMRHDGEGIPTWRGWTGSRCHPGRQVHPLHADRRIAPAPQRLAWRNEHCWSATG